MLTGSWHHGIGDDPHPLVARPRLEWNLRLSNPGLGNVQINPPGCIVGYAGTAISSA